MIFNDAFIRAVKTPDAPRSQRWHMIARKLPTRIVEYPDPRLRQRCAAVKVFDERLAALADRMLELMRERHGVGLAGPQVGACHRLFVCNPTGEPADDHIYVNPELSDLTHPVEAEEGCLSIPEVRVVIRRAGSCRIKAVNLKGEPIEEQAEILLARIWQHETDHLNGRLIIDAMNPTDKIATKKQLATLEERFKREAKTSRR